MYQKLEEHVSKVVPNHPLLPLVIDYLKDEEKERTLAEQLCERMAALKESQKYGDTGDKRENGGVEQVHHCPEDVQALQVQLEAMEISLQQKDALIATGEQELRECKEQNQRLNLEIDC